MVFVPHVYGDEPVSEAFGLSLGMPFPAHAGMKW